MVSSKFGNARVTGAIGVLTIALCIGVATATGAQHATAPVLRIGIATDVGQFDPSKTGNGPEPQFALAYTPLIQLKTGGKLAPGLATSWHYFNTKNGANKGFEFTLRHDARFSDGSVVTANAVKAWLQYFAGGTSPCCAAVVGPIRSIQTVGRWTVRLFLKSSNPIMPYALSEGFDVGYVVGPKAFAGPVKARHANRRGRPVCSRSLGVRHRRHVHVRAESVLLRQGGREVQQSGAQSNREPFLHAASGANRPGGHRRG